MCCRSVTAFTLLEVKAVDKLKMHLFETGIKKITRHHQLLNIPYVSYHSTATINSQSSGFIAPLSSQLEPQNPEPNICEKDSPSIELRELEAYVINTPWSEATSEDPTEADDQRLRRKWTPTKDVVLISVWLNTSKDPIVWNEQKTKAFWKRIAAYFASSPQLVGLQKREPSQYNQRLSKINDMVCKFIASYKAASSQKLSAQNDNYVMKLAHQIYFNDHKQKFLLEHAWREHKHDQKWYKKEAIVMSKKRKTEASSTQSSTFVPGSYKEDQVCPPSVKASKAKSKKTGNKTTKQGNALLEFQNMWEIKPKDLAMKEKLSKQKLLNSLLTKIESLSDIEMALKTS